MTSWQPLACERSRGAAAWWLSRGGQLARRPVPGAVRLDAPGRSVSAAFPVRCAVPHSWQGSCASSAALPPKLIFCRFSAPNFEIETKYQSRDLIEVFFLLSFGFSGPFRLFIFRTKSNVGLHEKKTFLFERWTLFFSDAPDVIRYSSTLVDALALIQPRIDRPTFGLRFG